MRKSKYVRQSDEDGRHTSTLALSEKLSKELSLRREDPSTREAAPRLDQQSGQVWQLPLANELGTGFRPTNSMGVEDQTDKPAEVRAAATQIFATGATQTADSTVDDAEKVSPGVELVSVCFSRGKAGGGVAQSVELPASFSAVASIGNYRKLVITSKAIAGRKVAPIATSSSLSISPDYIWRWEAYKKDSHARQRRSAHSHQAGDGGVLLVPTDSDSLVMDLCAPPDAYEGRKNSKDKPAGPFKAVCRSATRVVLTGSVASIAALANALARCATKGAVITMCKDCRAQAPPVAHSSDALGENVRRRQRPKGEAGLLDKDLARAVQSKVMGRQLAWLSGRASMWRVCAHAGCKKLCFLKPPKVLSAPAAGAAMDVDMENVERPAEDRLWGFWHAVSQDDEARHAGNLESMVAAGQLHVFCDGGAGAGGNAANCAQADGGAAAAAEPAAEPLAVEDHVEYHDSDGNKIRYGRNQTAVGAASKRLALWVDGVLQAHEFPEGLRTLQYDDDNYMLEDGERAPEREPGTGAVPEADRMRLLRWLCTMRGCDDVTTEVVVSETDATMVQDAAAAAAAAAAAVTAAVAPVAAAAAAPAVGPICPICLHAQKNASRCFRCKKAALSVAQLSADRITSSLGYVAFNALTKDLAAHNATRRSLERGSKADRSLVAKGGNIAWANLEGAAPQLLAQAIEAESLEELVRAEVLRVAEAGSEAVGAAVAGGSAGGNDMPWAAASPPAAVAGRGPGDQRMGQ